jgi:hypothetical protein
MVWIARRFILTKCVSTRRRAEPTAQDSPIETEHNSPTVSVNIGATVTNSPTPATCPAELRGVCGRCQGRRLFSLRENQKPTLKRRPGGGRCADGANFRLEKSTPYNLTSSKQGIAVIPLFGNNSNKYGKRKKHARQCQPVFYRR